ncbi:hypothetical protein [Sinorhizobium fredii]|uniref:hypothetical protein n=1 Tax=Rhizobium fredii TaxID=380 RepID=UPI003511379F
MKILDLQPVASHGGGNMRLVAYFDLDLSSEVRIYGLKLRETPDGRRVSYSPNGHGGRRLATFSPALAAAITEAVTARLRGQATANGTSSKD